MVQSNAATVDEYLDDLAPDRREVIEKVLAVAEIGGGVMRPACNVLTRVSEARQHSRRVATKKPILAGVSPASG